jgi:arylsulfatase A-like enzyme
VPGVIRTNHDNSWGYLSQDAVVLPTIMKTAGYHTALIGKWHLGLRPENHPNERGFDFFHGFLGDMMDDYYTHQRQGNDYMNRDRELIHPKGHATDLFTDWSCDYIKSRVGNQQPFCLSITYNAPHTPIQPPEEWFQKIKSRENGIEEKRAKLVALIEHLDAGVGKVIKTLEETGLDKNTLVIFTSDNGGQLNVGANNGGLRDGKQSMYEGGIRVPTCAVWPGKIAEGTKSNARILTMDILPTVCDAGEAKLEHKIDGVSFLSVLVGNTTTMPERDLFFHRREGGLRYGGLTTNALIRGRWKLLQNSPFAKQELYDLEADPVEANNLATKNRKKLNELTGALRAHVQRGGQVPWQKRD